MTLLPKPWPTLPSSTVPWRYQTALLPTESAVAPVGLDWRQSGSASWLSLEQRMLSTLLVFVCWLCWMNWCANDLSFNCFSSSVSFGFRVVSIPKSVKLTTNYTLLLLVENGMCCSPSKKRQLRISITLHPYRISLAQTSPPHPRLGPVIATSFGLRANSLGFKGLEICSSRSL